MGQGAILQVEEEGKSFQGLPCKEFIGIAFSQLAELDIGNEIPDIISQLCVHLRVCFVLLSTFSLNTLTAALLLLGSAQLFSFAAPNVFCFLLLPLLLNGRERGLEGKNVGCMFHQSSLIFGSEPALDSCPATR